MADRPARINYEDAVFAMTQRISGNAGFPATWPNCERIARETLKPLLSQDDRWAAAKKEMERTRAEADLHAAVFSQTGKRR